MTLLGQRNRGCGAFVGILLAAGCVACSSGAATPDAGAAAGSGGTTGTGGTGGASSDRDAADAAAGDAGGSDGSGGGSAGSTLKGHWVALGAPLGAQIGALGWGDDGTLFAGSSDTRVVVGGLFASSDRGATWRLASKGITTSGTSSIVATGSSVFAAVGYVLYRSADLGLTWQKVGGVSARSIAAQGSLVVLADPYYALSSDGGQTFAKGSGSAGTTSDDVAVLGDVVLRVTGGLLTRSADRGASFGPVQVTPASALSNVSFKCDRAKTCYADATSSQGAYHQLYRSTDAGASWMATGRDVGKVLAVTDEGSVYITNTAGEMERSDNGGANWETCPRPTNVACSVGVLVARGDQAFVACGNGVFRSDDRGRNWTMANGSAATGALTDAATVMLVDRTATASSPNGDLYVGAPFLGNNKLLSSADDGRSWRSLGVSTPVACTMSDAHTVFCVSSTGMVARSEDHGATWAAGNLGQFGGGTALAAGSSGIYLAANSKFGGVARSDDDGRTFVVANGTASYTSSLQVLKSGHLLKYGNLSKSVDRGETWTDCRWSVNVTQLPIPEDEDGQLYINAHGKLQISSDEGDSWTAVADSPPVSVSPEGALLARDGQGRFYANGPATASEPVIYFKENSSSAWGSFAAPPSPYILQLAIDKRDRLLAATTAGVYRFEAE